MAMAVRRKLLALGGGASYLDHSNASSLTVGTLSGTVEHSGGPGSFPC